MQAELLPITLALASFFQLPRQQRLVTPLPVGLLPHLVAQHLLLATHHSLHLATSLSTRNGALIPTPLAILQVVEPAQLPPRQQQFSVEQPLLFLPIPYLYRLHLCALE